MVWIETTDFGSNYI